jgi:TetR/AcrR family transcriptional repressor of nem operon
MAKPNVREQLLAAGLDALHRRGFNATSVQDITEVAGVPKGSFYNHFESKETLGAEVVLRYVENNEAQRAILRDTKLAPLTRLRKHFERLSQEVAKDNYSYGCLLGNFSTELSEQSPLIRERVATAFVAWSDLIAKVIAEAQTAGAVTRDLPPKALAAFLLNAFEGAMLRAKVDKSRAPFDAFFSVGFAKVLK